MYKHKEHIQLHVGLRKALEAWAQKESVHGLVTMDKGTKG